jgi:hypothetical protein
MKSALLVIFLGLCATAFADEFDSQVEEADARFLYFNTSSTATSLTLLGALILLGVTSTLSMLEVSSEDLLTTETITDIKVMETNTVNMMGNTLNTGKETAVVKPLIVAESNTCLSYSNFHLLT